MLSEFGERTFQRAFAEQDQFRQAFLLNGAYPAFGERIQVWTAGRQRQCLYTTCGQYRSEGCAELRVAIVQNIALLTETSRSVICRIASHLLHPSLCRMSSNSSDADASGLKQDEEQHVVRGQPFPGKYFDGKEVDSGKHIHVRADEVLPGGGLATFRRRCNAVAAQDVADGLIGNNVA